MFAEELEREEFLTTPALFRYGPRTLVLAGLVIAGLAIAVGFWRIHDGRKSEYEKAFHAAAADAAAANENVRQVLTRLGQAGEYMASIQGARDQPQQFGAVLRGLGVPGVAVSATGQVLAVAGWPPEIGSLAAQALRDPRARGLAPGGQVMLPALRLASGHVEVPVVQRLARPGPVADLVFLLDAQALTAIVRKAVGHEGGWLRIDDAAGHQVLSLLMPSSRPGAAGKPHDRLLTPEQAMRGPLDGDSQRLLVASTPATPGAPRVEVGLTEATATVGVRKRIVGTWVTVGFAMPVFGFLLLTSLALRRFARVEEYLRRLARVDVLTGLPNRRSFQSLLRSAVERSRRRRENLALLFVDIDNFKYVNDSLGHAHGDELLRHVAQALLSVVREGDLVCRLGGDEFTVVSAKVSDAQAAVALGHRMLDRLRQAVRIEGVELRTRASVGIALMPQNALTAEDMIRFADTAMHRAKTGGKDQCVVYDASMAAEALAKAQTIQQLESGIAADKLFLVYQPKFALAGGACVGHEALVRWQHPARGVVYPGDFIALAEESGLIVELGNWVLEQALRQIAQWQRQGLGWQAVAVNVSALQLRDGGFAARVEAALARHGVPGTCLQLEITESCLAADVEQVKAMVRSLRGFGVLVAVDDFGTGYSSLGALQQFDLDMLKVDRSFVALLHTRQGMAVCRAVITLGHAMGMTVVAEGVETVDQAEALVGLGCDQVQGYYFARPMPAELAGQADSELARRIGSRAVAPAPRAPSGLSAVCETG